MASGQLSQHVNEEVRKFLERLDEEDSDGPELQYVLRCKKFMQNFVSETATKKSNFDIKNVDG
jgi:hypothetical protein